MKILIADDGDITLTLLRSARTKLGHAVREAVNALAGKREVMLASSGRAVLTQPLDVRSLLGVVDRFLAAESSGLG
jgi:hypothetical protein